MFESIPVEGKGKDKNRLVRKKWGINVDSAKVSTNSMGSLEVRITPQSYPQLRKKTGSPSRLVRKLSSP